MVLIEYENALINMDKISCFDIVQEGYTYRIVIELQGTMEKRPISDKYNSLEDARDTMDWLKTELVRDTQMNCIISLPSNKDMNAIDNYKFSSRGLSAILGR